MARVHDGKEQRQETVRVWAIAGSRWRQLYFGLRREQMHG